MKVTLEIPLEEYRRYAQHYKPFEINQGEGIMDNSNECAFDQALRDLINKFSSECLLSAGEIIAVLSVVTHEFVHNAIDRQEVK